MRLRPLWVLATQPAAVRMDLKVEFDTAFNFKAVSTWGWNPAGPGEVKMARTADDDPDAARQRAEPIVVHTVKPEIARRGLTVRPLTRIVLLKTGQRRHNRDAPSDRAVREKKKIGFRKAGGELEQVQP